MWFRNLIPYRLQSEWPYDPAAAAEALEPHAFEPCGTMEMERAGWIPPLGPEAPLVHGANGCLLFCLQQESKVLPASVIREGVEERVGRIEAAEQRKVRKRERDRLRDELLVDLLPRAFSRHKQTWGYLDTQAGYFLVDAGSEKQAELFVEQLREAWGALPVAPPDPVDSPAGVMTRWLAQQRLPGDVQLGEDAVLEDPASEGTEVRVKRQDLTSSEMRAHIDAGKRVRRLALTWAERLEAVLDADLSLRRLRFLDVVKEQAGDRDAETRAEQIDADFALMALEFRALLPRLLELFGGER